MKTIKIVLISVLATVLLIAAVAGGVIAYAVMPHSAETALGYRKNQVAKIIFRNGDTLLQAETTDPEEIQEFLSLFDGITLTVNWRERRPSELVGSHFNVYLYNEKGVRLSAFECHADTIDDYNRDRVLDMSKSFPEGILQEWEKCLHISMEDLKER